MCKKLCLAVGAVIVGLVVITFTGLGTLAQVKWHEANRWMEKQVPPETQLKRLQAEISKIDGDIKKNLGKVAAQQVEVERLEANLAAVKEQQAKLREDIAVMTKALDSKEQPIQYNGKKYRPSELAIRLDSKVSEYETLKTSIKTKEQVLAAKRQSLELAHARINEMRVQKDQLKETAAKLETRIEKVNLERMDCPVDLDGSQVSKCRELADKLDRQLAEDEAQAKLLKQYGYDKDRKTVTHDEKTIDEIQQAAKKALQDDDEKVVDGK
jgi:chromosome segregation ATPase